MSTDRDILLARARVLARPAQHEQMLAATDALTLLVFTAGEERFGIPVDHVRAVGRATGIVPLPRARAPIYGIAGWRGRPITVFTLTPSAPVLTDTSRFVLLGEGVEAQAAVLADAVNDVIVVARDSLTPRSASTLAIPALGVTPDAVLVLDPSALLGARGSDITTSPDRPRPT